jgi:hypothetical protein
MYESVFYAVRGAHHHIHAQDPLGVARDALAETLVRASRIVTEKEIGVTDDRVVPFPNPVPDVRRAVEELFPRSRSYEVPWSELATFYALNERPPSQLEWAVTSDLDELTPAQLYRRLGDVLGYITSLPRGPADGSDGGALLTKVDLLELMNRATRSGDRSAVSAEIRRYAHEAANTYHRIASLKGYCRRAIREEGFALGRLAVEASHPDQIEHISRSLAEDQTLMLSRIDDGVRIRLPARKRYPRS